MTKVLFVGGMIAGGFDSVGRYLLTVSHSGRGLFEIGSWQRVARDTTRAYPEHGVVMGIGPLEGVAVQVREIDYATEVLSFSSPDGTLAFHYSEGTLTVSPATESAQPKNA